MRTVDRQSIHIEQCESCRGIFLDGGELEQIIGAEKRHYAPEPIPPYQPDQAESPRAPAQPQPWGHRDSPRGYSDSPRGYRDSPGGFGGGYGGQGKKRRKRSFLEDLFD